MISISKTIFTQLIVTSRQLIQPFIHLWQACALYLLSVPGRSSPEQHLHSRSAASGQQSSEREGRQFVFSFFSSLQNQWCEAKQTQRASFQRVQGLLKLPKMQPCIMCFFLNIKIILLQLNAGTCRYRMRLENAFCNFEKTSGGI